jgi:hypothetical protein
MESAALELLLGNAVMRVYRACALKPLESARHTGAEVGAPQLGCLDFGRRTLLASTLPERFRSLKTA